MACRLSEWPRGSITKICAPRFAALLEESGGDRMIFRRVGADHDDHVGVSAAVNGAVTAPEPIPSISAATDEAWQSRVQ